MTKPATQAQDPHLWPDSRRLAVARELTQGQDTLAGLARRYDLPVQEILDWRNQLQRESGHPAPRNGKNLLIGGIGAGQSRFSGPC